MRFENGEPFYMLGNTAYNALLTHQQNPDAMAAFLDFYQARGFNWLRFALMQTTWPTGGALLWPWGGTPDEPDYERLDLAHMRRIEAFVEELARRDTIASVILFMPADRTLEGIAWEPLERFVRHVVARLGAQWNVVWNLANEWQRENVFSYERMDALGQLVQESDPYGHLTSCHHYARCEFHDRDWVDMSSIQHRGLPHEVHRVVL